MNDNNFLKDKVKSYLALKVGLALAPIFLILFVVMVVVVIVAINVAIGDDSSNGGGGNNVATNNGECGFTISQTSLSKSEFKDKISEYAKSHSHWQVFVDNANDYYDYAKSVNVNPELVITIANKEKGGKETAGKNNYWGLNCPNGSEKCGDYDSFMDGAKAIIDSASKYDSLIDWFVKGHYSWIGDYWYNPGSSGLGGCYYFNGDYCYDSSTNTYKCLYSEGNPPQRVVDACASGKSCDENGGGDCVKTTNEDQEEYAKYLISGMAKFRKTVFGLDADEGVSCATGVDSAVTDADVATIMSWDQETAWKNLIGTATTDGHPSVSESLMDSRVTTIEVPYRKWSGSGSNPVTDTTKGTLHITVNKAIAPLWSAFFEDLYQNATDYVIGTFEGCYEYRPITNGTSLSPHAYGVACDLNADTYGNGYEDASLTADAWNKLPESQAKYQVAYIGSKAVQIAHKYTLVNGSDWSNPHDAMHFSYISDWTRDRLKACQGKVSCG